MKKTFVATALLLCMNVFAHSGDNFVESDLFGNLAHVTKPPSSSSTSAPRTTTHGR